MTTCTYQGLQYAVQYKIKERIIDSYCINIIEKVAERCEVTPQQILSNSRLEHVVEARRFAICIIHSNRKILITELGKIFRRHHSTIIYSIRQHDDLMKFDKLYKAKYIRLSDNIFKK